MANDKIYLLDPAILEIPFIYFLDKLPFDKIVNIVTQSCCLRFVKKPVIPKVISFPSLGGISAFSNDYKSENLVSINLNSEKENMIPEQTESFKNISDDSITTSTITTLSMLLTKCLKDTNESTTITISTSESYQITKPYHQTFKEIRSLCSISEDDFANSITNISLWHPNGGKKCKEFYKTSNRRFILKRLDSPESNFINKKENGEIILNYLIDNCENSILSKLLGIFCISNYLDGKVEERRCYAVLENLFRHIDQDQDQDQNQSSAKNTKILRLFDLKGSNRNRRSENPGKIIWDTDYKLKHRYSRPLDTFDFSKQDLINKIKKDTLFLQTQNIMDYSLIVLENEKTYDIGIVDYLRCYTWDKALESIVKTYLPENITSTNNNLEHSANVNESEAAKKSGDLASALVSMPTIVPAKEYRARFIDAIQSYFLEIPFDWKMK